VLTDALATGADNRGHQLGSGAPHLLIRSVTCVEGSIEVDVVFAPRPEYGLLRPLLSEREGCLAVRGGAEWLVLSSPVPLILQRSTARARIVMTAGRSRMFGLHRSTGIEQAAGVWSQHELADRLAATVAAWRSWSALHQTYDGPWRDLVHHSGRVLQGLTFQPSGGIVAAATTSLQECAGGERNWNYRAEERVPEPDPVAQLQQAGLLRRRASSHVMPSRSAAWRSSAASPIGSAAASSSSRLDRAGRAAT
jgi:hypothetical protein